MSFFWMAYIISHTIILNFQNFVIKPHVAIWEVHHVNDGTAWIRPTLTIKLGIRVCPMQKEMQNENIFLLKKSWNL